MTGCAARGASSSFASCSCATPSFRGFPWSGRSGTGPGFAETSWRTRGSENSRSIICPTSAIDSYLSAYGPAPRTPYLDNRVPYNWHWFWHWGNGELGNNGVHALDACRWGLGVDFPVRVTSSGGRYWFDDDQETPDSHVVAFEFPGGKQIVWDGMSCNRKGCGFVTFYGSGGSLALDGTGGYVVYNEGVEEVGRDKGPLGDDEHIADFLAACRGGDPLSVSAEIEDAQRSTLLCHLGNIAHRTGRTLNCRPEDGRILSDDGAMAYWRRDYEPGWEPTV
jgi:hypothetical protein